MPNAKPQNPSCKILVAEDDKFLSRAYEFKLAKTGCQIILAADGEETMAKVKAEMPDLVILDLIMPKKNGFDVLDEMKASPKLKNIPVIIMSNLGQEADIKKGLAAGAIDYVVKANTSLEDVVNRIEKVLKRDFKIQVPPIANPKADSAVLACPACQKPFPKDAKFCPNCGKKV